MKKIKDAKYSNKKTYKRKRRNKVNYNIEKRRQKLIRQQRRREMIESSDWKEKLLYILSYAPMVGGWILKIALVVLVAFFYVSCFGHKISVVGDSMRPELENGDVVLMNRISYKLHSPKRGDVIAFKPHGNKNTHYYIKRVIGLPGETIEFVGGKVYINDKEIEEKYEATDVENVGTFTKKTKLKKNEYFVLGDDRINSEDSRNSSVGLVKKEYIYGKAWYCVSSEHNKGFVK